MVLLAIYQWFYWLFTDDFTGCNTRTFKRRDAIPSNDSVLIACSKSSVPGTPGFPMLGVFVEFLQVWKLNSIRGNERKHKIVKQNLQNALNKIC